MKTKRSKILNSKHIKVTTTNPQKLRAKKFDPFNTVTAKRLDKIKFPPMKWFVNGLLPEGFAVLAGRPKTGKSILSLNIALSVARGFQAMKRFNCEKHSVYMIALEDPLRRIQSRLNKMLGSIPKPHNLEIHCDPHSWPKLNEGGIKKLEYVLKKRPDIKLIIIDIYEKMINSNRPKNSSEYAEEYGIGGALQELANKMNACILVIQHKRKAAAENEIDEVLGTTGKTAAPDTVLTLSKTKQDVTLKVTGRELGDANYRIKLNEKNLTWELDGDGSGDYVSLTPPQQEVFNWFQKQPKLKFRLKHISTLTKQSNENAHRKLGLLEDKNLIKKVGHGRYQLISKSA